MIKIWQLIQINYQIIRLSSVPDFIFIRNALGQSTLQKSCIINRIDIQNLNFKGHSTN